jgi:hypothetical protein
LRSLWRRSRVFRITTWIALAIAVLFVLPWGYLYWRTERDLQAELHRIRAAGEPTSVSDLVPPEVPGDENAADLYRQVFNLNLAPGSPSASTPFSRSPHSEFIETGYLEGSVNHSLARQALEDPAIEDALRILRRASERPRCILPINWAGEVSTVTHLIAFREASWWLYARARLSAHEGDTEEALSWCVVALRVAGHCAEDPMLIASDIARSSQRRMLLLAEDIMAEEPVSREVALDLLRKLQARDTLPAVRTMLLRDRALSIDGYAQTREDGSSFPSLSRVQRWDLDDPGFLWQLRLYRTPPGRPVVNADALACLDHYREMIERTSEGDLDSALLQWVQDYEPQGMYRHSLAKNQIKHAAISASGHAIATARMKLFETALALQMHHARHGECPESLAALNEPSGWEVPRDPCTGEPLRYQRDTAGGYTLYSVGPDLDDDGGVPFPARGNNWYGDVVWRGRAPSPTNGRAGT